jgi:hypothetical protein
MHALVEIALLDVDMTIEMDDADTLRRALRAAAHAGKPMLSCIVIRKIEIVLREAKRMPDAWGFCRRNRQRAPIRRDAIEIPEGTGKPRH